MGNEKVAVLSGATGRIGLAIAGALRRDGYRVVGLCRTVTEGQQVPFDRLVACDVRSREDVRRLPATLNDLSGSVCGVVNSVGVVQRRDGSGRHQSTSEVVAVNLLGVMWLCEALLPLMCTKGGAIVNISSSLAVRPVAGAASYSASKAGLEAYSQALALECAPDVRVNVVRPALVDSDIWVKAGMPRSVYAEFAAARGAGYPMRRIGVPQDVAGAVRYLLSEEASWVTGAVLAVDGGAGI